jgi:hypothetical protein
MLEQAGEKGHAPRCEGLVEHRAREAVDLHDEEPPVRGRRGSAPPQAADQAIDGALCRESQPSTDITASPARDSPRSVLQAHRSAQQRAANCPDANP